MTVCRIKHNNIYVRSLQRFCSIQHVRRNTKSSSAEQTALIIMGTIRILDGFFNIFNCYKSLQAEVFINDRKLFYLGLAQNSFRLFQRCSLRSGNQMLTGHTFTDRTAEIVLEQKITVGNDTDQFPIVFCYGNA